MRNLLLALFLIPTVFSCCLATAGSNEPIPDYTITLDPVPDSRSFYMGLVPHPHDYTLGGVNEAYKIIGNHADMIAHHFDDGVPWPEAYEGKPYHPNVEDELNDRIKRSKPDQKVYLAIAPLHADRYHLTEYWGEESLLERPGEWKDRGVGAPEVGTAYINFCLDMIERFDPDYMNYGVEVNESWASPTNPDFVEFLEFAETVYTALKEKHPDLPIFVSLSRSSLTMSEEQIEIDRKLLQFSDYVAVSTYPFVYSEYAPDEADPADLPASWFSDMADLAPDKPFAIAETSYIAEDLVADEYDLTIKGDAAHQAGYVEFLLEEMHHLDAEFVVWFVPRDYDQGWKRYGHVLPSWAKTWRDCGLFDGRGNPRPALGVWNAWLAIPGE